MDEVAKIIGAAVVALLIVVALSLFGTVLWFCFDDKLAEVTGVAELGHIPWYNVWPFTILVSFLFKSGNATAARKQN